jgi:hypothetical protein
MSRMVCLIAQIVASMNILNMGGGMFSSAMRDNSAQSRDTNEVRKLTREATGVDGAKKTVEAAAMLRILGEVLVDHIERGLKHSIEHRRNLRREKTLK